MKPLQTIYLLPMLVLSHNAIAQESQTIRVLPVDPETNCQLRYYYYPNLEAYFDKQTDIYIFRDKGEWKRDKEIPSGYRGYGLFNKANIAINDYDDENPTQFIEKHRKRFPYNSLKRTRATATATASVE